MKSRITLILSLLAILIPAAVMAQENWPQWRGPQQNGVSTAKDLPLTWSDSENILWKAPMPAWSGGSPVVWGDRVFVTSPSAGEGGDAQYKGREPGGPELMILCFSTADGSLRWQQVLDTGNKLSRKQNDSSPTPVTDGQHVWVVTGTGAVAALDMEGNLLWKKNIQKDHYPFGLNFGYASSPILLDGKLIIQVLHGYRTDDPSYLLAYNALTGEELWYVERPTDAPAEVPDAYTTPTHITVDGQTQLIISGGAYVTGHNPDTGAEIWRIPGLNPENSTVYRIIASPVVAGDMIYAPSRKKPMLALRVEKQEGGPPMAKLVWKYEDRHGPDVPTPACDGNRLYMFNDIGMITCMDARTGSILWGPERSERGNVSASPILADGRLYIINENATTTVLAASDQFQTLAINKLDGGYTLSTPAIADSRIYLRTAMYLYCIGEK